MFKSTIKYLKISTTAFLAVVLLLCSFTTIAVTDKYPSPTKDNEYVLIVHNTKGGLGTRFKLDKNYYKAVAKEKDGYKFTHWAVKGKYILQKGNLKSKTIKLTLRSDCEATPYFKPISKDKDNTPIKINESPISPKTGDIGNNSNLNLLGVLSISFFIVLIVFLAITGGLISSIIKHRRKKSADE